MSSNADLLKEIGASEFGIDSGDEDVGRRNNRWSPKEGTFRVSFMQWPGLAEKGVLTAEAMDAKTPTFVGAKLLYSEAIGTAFFAKSPEYAKLFPGERVKEYAATLITVWPLNGLGEIDMPAVKDGKGKVYVWRMPSDKYGMVRDQHRDWPLGKFDMKVTVTDATFQKMTFNPYQNSFLRSLVVSSDKPDIKAVLTPLYEKAKAILDTGVVMEMALNLSIDELKDRLGKGTPGGAAAVAAPNAGAVDMVLDGLITSGTEE